MDCFYIWNVFWSGCPYRNINCATSSLSPKKKEQLHKCCNIQNRYIHKTICLTWNQRWGLRLVPPLDADSAHDVLCWCLLALAYLGKLSFLGEKTDLVLYNTQWKYWAALRCFWTRAEQLHCFSLSISSPCAPVAITLKMFKDEIYVLDHSILYITLTGLQI